MAEVENNLPDPFSRVIIALMKGVVYQENDPALWQDLFTLQALGGVLGQLLPRDEPGAEHRGRPVGVADADVVGAGREGRHAHGEAILVAKRHVTELGIVDPDSRALLEAGAEDHSSRLVADPDPVGVNARDLKGLCGRRDVDFDVCVLRVFVFVALVV